MLRFAAVLIAALVGSVSFCRSQESSLPPTVYGVERQPLEAGVMRVVEALELAGSPLPTEDRKKLQALRSTTDASEVSRGLQALMDRHCLAVVQINAESRVKVEPAPASPRLIQQGWTNFLVKVVNEAGVTAPLSVSSPQARPMVRRSTSSAEPEMKITPADASRRWLDIDVVDSQPLRDTLSGLKVEYRIIQLYARDDGKREATLAMHVGQGTQDLGFRSELPILFDCQPSVEVPLRIRDESGQPTTCSLLIKDAYGRVYPNPSRRLAPDFFFHQQIYRHDGETIRLAPGTYQVTAYRGPEYHRTSVELKVEPENTSPLEIDLKRWIHMAEHGWYSGDHHVHAAGCSHYENPSQGVQPADMMRHILGEDLNVGCVLSWGPCWYFQKQFFEGDVSELSKPNYLMRYDVEVSGFPSSHAGHLCLLRLTEDDYPDAEFIEDWPSWTLPVLRWGKSQGGVVGYSHSGWGLALPDILPDGSRGNLPKTWGGASGERRGRAANRLPDYAMPPFDGIGANEYIVTVAHDACDFISAVDTPAIWELNIWYHTLNCGFRARISGETDFPCIYGERVGLGRSYVELPKVSTGQPLSFDEWVNGLKAGRSYVGDGLSHLLSFSVGEQSLGTPGNDGSVSELTMEASGEVPVRCRVAAMLPEQIDEKAEQIAARRLDEKPYWHLERARKAGTRKVPVELIVNGEAVAKQWIIADGKPKDLEFSAEIKESSWLAIRILPSMHSNPIFAIVNDQPIRASRRSAQWCRDAVDVCWAQKRGKIRGEEMEDAKAAYDFARQAYERIASECD